MAEATTDDGVAVEATAPEDVGEAAATSDDVAGAPQEEPTPAEMEEGVLESLTKEEDLDEGPIKCAARKCERIMEAIEAVQNKQMRTMLEERLARAERELDQLIEFGASQQNGAKVLATRPTKGGGPAGTKSPKARTTESVKSRFKGVYGVRSLKKGSVRWTAKLLKDNTWYRDGSYTDEEEAARAVDARLRAWGRDDECNFDDAGAERPARERKHGSSKRRQPVGGVPDATNGKRAAVSVHHHPTLQLQQPSMSLFPN